MTDTTKRKFEATAFTPRLKPARRAVSPAARIEGQPDGSCPLAKNEREVNAQVILKLIEFLKSL